MAQVAGNRGNQSLYSSIPSARQSRRVISGQVMAQNPQAVRFGGGFQNAMTGSWQGFVNFSLPTFEKITEVFLWAFLAQDVVAMWVPRIYALLTEGRSKYDPKADPKAKDLPFGKQVGKWVDGNIKGLNWGNFKEGTKREFATGPGLLMVPAALFMLANKLANPSVTLPYAVAEGMGAGLAEHLKDKPTASFEAELKNYINSIFVDPDLKNHTWQAPDSSARNLKTWSEDWVKHLFNEYPTAQAKEEKLKSLGDELKKEIRHFNRNGQHQRILPYEKEGTGIRSLMSDKNPLHRSEATWISYEPMAMAAHLEQGAGAQAKAKLRQIPVAEVLSDLERMSGLVKTIGEKATGSVTLSESARLSTEQLVKMKFGLAVSATVITAAYLTKLAFWAQSHGSYQATRLLNEKALANSSPNKPKTSRSAQAAPAMNNAHCLASAPQSNSALAGSAFGLQPVFSVAPSQGQRLPLGLPGLPPRSSGLGSHAFNATQGAPLPTSVPASLSASAPSFAAVNGGEA